MKKQFYYSVDFYFVSGRELNYLTTNLYRYSDNPANRKQLLTVVRRECREMELLLWKETYYRGKVVFRLGPKPSDSFIVESDALDIPKELQ